MTGPVTIDLPPWAHALAAERDTYPTDDDRIGLAIRLSRENVERGAGGPFGAAVFEEPSGRLVAVGVNSVQRLNNCTLHAETTALMFAGRSLGCHTMQRDDGVTYTLATSCDPCAMCLGAVLWSGVRRVLCGATRDDAMAVGFDEGPVFTHSWDVPRRAWHHVGPRPPPRGGARRAGALRGRRWPAVQRMTALPRPTPWRSAPRRRRTCR
jgi:tRNA(Arg) A34 adenosine deaminase TadA